MGLITGSSSDIRHLLFTDMFFFSTMRDNSETRDQSLDENVHVLPETQAATLLLLLQAQHVISLRCLCNKTDFHPTVISLTHLHIHIA